jgi:predicted small lipoprotein YifL
MKHYLLLITLCFVMSSALTACGIKPGKLMPPPGSEETNFPREYPRTFTNGGDFNQEMRASAPLNTPVNTSDQ